MSQLRSGKVCGEIEDLLEPRRSGNDFRWASRQFTPSSYFVRGKEKDIKEILANVLQTDKVKEAIAEVATKHGREEKEIVKEAQAILTELTHDYHLYAIRWFGLILSKLGKRLYNSIQVNTEKLNEIKQAFENHPVILLPTHRSYVDFLLISYICFHYQLPLPIIAAGMDFMHMAGVGEFLRKSGAFFIRRKFGGDRLYWALVSEFVKGICLEGGHPLEMFVEGTRSRSGKSISPKVGLLSTALELVTSSQISDILILPISMSYDRTLEERLYAHEMLGTPKPKESTNGLMKALRWLGSQSYGSVYVNFGSPVSFRKFSSLRNPEFPLNSSIQEASLDIAIEVILEHKRNLILPLFPLISIVLLYKMSRRESRCSIEDLVHAVGKLEDLLLASNYKVGRPNRSDSLEGNIRLVLKLHSALVPIQLPSSFINLTGEGENMVVDWMILQHYSNQILPLILPYTILATLRNEQGDWEESVGKDFIFLRRLLHQDFVSREGTELEEMERSMETLKGLEVEEEIWGILESGLEPYLIAYAATSSFLLREGGGELKGLCRGVQEEVRSGVGGIYPRQFGAMCLETLNYAASVHQTIKMSDGSVGIVVEDKEKLAALATRLRKMLKVPPSVLPSPPILQLVSKL